MVDLRTATVRAVKEDFLGFLEFCCASWPLLSACPENSLSISLPVIYDHQKGKRRDTLKWVSLLFLGILSFSAEILKLGLELRELEFLF